MIELVQKIVGAVVWFVEFIMAAVSGAVGAVTSIIAGFTFIVSTTPYLPSVLAISVIFVASFALIRLIISLIP